MASNLGSSGLDVAVHDTVTGSTKTTSSNPNRNKSNGISSIGSMSSDGQIIVFESKAYGYVVGGANGNFQVFIGNSAYKIAFGSDFAASSLDTSCQSLALSRASLDAERARHYHCGDRTGHCCARDSVGISQRKKRYA